MLINHAAVAVIKTFIMLSRSYNSRPHTRSDYWPTISRRWENPALNMTYFYWIKLMSHNTLSTDWENEGGWTKNSTRDAEDGEVRMSFALVQAISFCIFALILVSILSRKISEQNAYISKLEMTVQNQRYFYMNL